MNNLYHEEAEIGYMALKQFKGKTCMKYLPQTEALKLDAIYFDYHELNEAQCKGLYIPSVMTNLKKMIDRNMVSEDVSIVFSHS